MAQPGFSGREPAMLPNPTQQCRQVNDSESYAKSGISNASELSGS
jgi:hypothetical protein